MVINHLLTGMILQVMTHVNSNGCNSQELINQVVVCQVDGRDDHSLRDDCSVSPLRRLGLENGLFKVFPPRNIKLTNIK